jgi:hypothetical protein
MTRTGPPSRLASWQALSDPPGFYSTGVGDFDRLLGGGFHRGSFAMFHVPSSVSTEDLHTLLFPTILNFLFQRRGMIAVLPAREDPKGFRADLLPYVSRRRFDSRVRIVDYVGEADDAPYVVSLRGLINPAQPSKKRDEAMNRMAAAEKAARGARTKSFCELTSLEVLETVVGGEMASRMYFHGVKRTRQVGNLGIAIARPGLACLEAVRSMMDYEFELRRTDVGLQVSGQRPFFPPHIVSFDRRRGRPNVEFTPSPPAERIQAGPAGGTTRSPESIVRSASR